jgi:hypothetical protein
MILDLFARAEYLDYDVIYYYTGALFYLTAIVFHFPLLLRRACGGWMDGQR